MSQPNYAPTPSTTTSSSGPAPAVGASPGGRSKRSDLRGMSYDEGVAALAPPGAPVQAKEAPDADSAGKERKRPTGRAMTINTMPDGTRCKVLIGRGKVHGLQPGVHVSFGSRHGVRLVGKVVEVYPTRAYVRLNVAAHWVSHMRSGTFIDAAPMTEDAQLVQARDQARQQARAAKRQERAKGDRDGAAAAPEKQPEEKGEAGGEQERAPARVDVREVTAVQGRDADGATYIRLRIALAVDGQAVSEELIVKTSAWSAAAKRSVVDLLREGGVDKPASGDVAKAMRVIRARISEAKRTGADRGN